MRLEVDSVDRTLTIDGVEFAFEVLQDMTRPNPHRFLSFEREGNRVIAHQFDPRDPALQDAVYRATQALVAEGKRTK